jgi:L-alanine-DL-glutamate epimerase-like enolase superfamily enzyme
VAKATDIEVVGAQIHFLPVATRVPLKFGPETLTQVTCARARLRVAGSDARTADGWGETPLSVQWAWPSIIGYEERHEAMKGLCAALVDAWAQCGLRGHPMEIGSDFLEQRLPALVDGVNAQRAGREPMPWLAALICCSAFDIALHDAYGRLHGRPVYDTYCAEYMSRDLAHYLTPAADARVSFAGKFPGDFLVRPRPNVLAAWHLVGGKDVLSQDELTGSEPQDGYPVLLPDWIARDGLRCLKVKLRGDDAAWDFDRLVAVGKIARRHRALWLSSDFNCTVADPAYVTGTLDRLMREHPRIWQMILYVEQPFPYDLEANPIDVHCVSARKPLFMDESAHDWRLARMGRGLGWTGVALKTCKTQTGALLTLCWAKAHGMTLMVQDLTNPMLAQVPHVLLAAHAGTIMGVETNAMQFYPDASLPEAAVHPGLYRRRRGAVRLSTIRGPGFGYRIDEIQRQLPPAARTAGDCP